MDVKNAVWRLEALYQTIECKVANRDALLPNGTVRSTFYDDVVSRIPSVLQVRVVAAGLAGGGGGGGRGGQWHGRWQALAGAGGGKWRVEPVAEDGGCSVRDGFGFGPPRNPI